MTIRDGPAGGWNDGWASGSTGRRLTRRRYVAALSALGGAAVATACGASTQAPAAKTAAPVTVVFMQNDSNTAQRPEGSTRVSLLQEFTKTNAQQITVDVEGAQATADNDKIKSLVAAGTPPDLYYTAYYYPAEFYVAGMTIDVETELKADKEWAKQRADIVPTMLDSSSWAGKLISIPGYTNNQAMIYNLGLLQQAGVATPKQGWTWDDFKTVVPKFVKPGIIPLSMAWAGTWNHWLGTTGQRPISKDVKKITFDTPEMLQVMEMYLDFLKRGIIQKTADGKGALFETYRDAKNDTVFEVQGPYRIPVIRQNKGPDFGTIHIPVHPTVKQVFASNGGHNLIVFKDVPVAKRAAAAQVAKWLNAPHAQAQMCINATSIPVSKSVGDTKELQDYLKTDPAFKGFVDLAPSGWRWPTLPSYSKISPTLDAAVTSIMLDQVGAKAALADAQQKAQQFLDADVALMK